jgi:Tfp pilus assembly protein PilV
MTYPTPKQQSGATLIVALVFLVVLTIAGITAMQFSTMEERMASNSQFRNEMFQQTQNSLEANFADINADASGRALLLQASNAGAYNSGSGNYPVKLTAAELAQLGLPTTASRAISAGVSTQNSAGYSLLRNVHPGRKCENMALDASSLEKVECIGYELQVREELPNGAYSDQSLGLRFMNLKSTN